MGSQAINTARFNDLTAIDSLNGEQLAAVRRLRAKAESQGTNPYVLGLLANRQMALLERFDSGKRFLRISPASREILIAEIKEVTDPYVPAVVSVWSAWCEQNNVDMGAPVLAKHAEPTVKFEAPAVDLYRDPDPVIEPAKRRYEVGARKRCVDEIKRMTSSGSAPSRNEVSMRLKALGFSGGTIRNAMDELKQRPAVEPVVDGITTMTRGRRRDGRNPESAALGAAAVNGLTAISKRLGVSPYSLSRWAQMMLTPWGSVYGKTLLPDRESDEGIELAEEVFQACLPLSPAAAAERSRIRLLK